MPIARASANRCAGAVPSANRVRASQPTGWRVERSQIGWKTGLKAPSSMIRRISSVDAEPRSCVSSWGPRSGPACVASSDTILRWRAIQLSGEAVCVEAARIATARPRWRMGADTTTVPADAGRSIRGSTRPPT